MEIWKVYNHDKETSKYFKNYSDAKTEFDSILAQYTEALKSYNEPTAFEIYSTGDEGISCIDRGMEFIDVADLVKIQVL